MNRERDMHNVGRRYVGWAVMLFGTVVAALGARDVVGFEPLPPVISPDTILAFLDFQRYFGVWPGLLGIVTGVGFLVLGLLVLMGFGEKPLQVNEVVEPPPPPRSSGCSCS